MRRTHYAVIASMLVCAATCTPHQRAQRHYQRQNYTEAARVLDGGRLSGEANRLFRSARAHIELANANAALAAGDYGRAAADYRRALWFGPIEPSAKSAALRGRCLAELHGENLRTAAAACADFRKDTPRHPDLDRVEAQLKRRAVAAVEQAFDEGKAEDARAALSIYDSLPGAHRADELTGKVGVLEARAEQLRNEMEEARVREARVKDVQQRQLRDAAVQRALPELRRRWGLVEGATEDVFLAWALSSTTVLGHPIFADADIVEKRWLRLWVSDSDLIGANHRLFADLADAFVLWCHCDGLTTVGLDLHYIGGGRPVLMKFRLDDDTGRSSWRFGQP